MKYEELVLYRNLKHGDILEGMSRLYEGEEGDAAFAARMVGEILELSGKYGFSGNLWHAFLTYCLVNNENVFSRAMEMRDVSGGSLYEAALKDMSKFRKFFHWKLENLGKRLGTEVFSLLLNYIPPVEEGETFNKRVRDRIIELAAELNRAESDEEFLLSVKAFYREYGVGVLGLHKAFRIRAEGGALPRIEPIRRVQHTALSDIVGMESQKELLMQNTEAFLKGRKANNVLLFGDAGTGKSSCIKGIINKYYADGLRIIELYKHQLKYLSDVIAMVKHRNYRFIIYMDDLSFEDQEVEYKYLKAVIEGGLEKKPDNVLIYATSNRRHLIHEGFKDRLDRGADDDVHESDTMQEKLSLASRFGITIYFGSPDKKEYDHIVRVLSERYGITMPEEELLLLANRFELSHGGRSGRTAEQFIHYLLGVVLPGK